MTLRDLLEKTVAEFPTRTALRYKAAGLWTQCSYQELRQEIVLMADVFGSLNIVPHQSRVALMLDNSPEWIVSYFALAGCGTAVVPIDPKLSPDELMFILRDSESSMLITHEKQVAMLRQRAVELPALHSIIALEPDVDDCALSATMRLYNYSHLRAHALSAETSRWYEDHKPVDDDIASIIYTSGTMGVPKGAMLSHNNFCSDVFGSLAAVDYALDENDDFLVVLPLFHSFSFTANLLLAIACGAGLGFVENLRTLAEDMKELRPTIVMAVPLLCEKLYHRIYSRLQENRTTRSMLKLGLGRLLGRSVRAKMGGRLRYMITGGAPCPVDIINGFKRIGITLVEGYGLTECSPVVSFPKLTAPRIGTIGRPLPNAEVRIADPDHNGVGELQVRGAMVMQGYFRNEQSTAEAFDGDWLRTGDIAVIDSDGYLRICGRKKALIVNREGKNIYPEEVENVLALDPLLRDVVVLGYKVGSDPGERIGVIVAPDEEMLRKELGTRVDDHAAVEALVRRHLTAQCERLAAYKHPRKVVISREPLQRTSVQKVRRCLYQRQLDE